MLDILLGHNSQININNFKHQCYHFHCIATLPNWVMKLIDWLKKYYQTHCELQSAYHFSLLLFLFFNQKFLANQIHYHLGGRKDYKVAANKIFFLEFLFSKQFSWNPRNDFTELPSPWSPTKAGFGLLSFGASMAGTEMRSHSNLRDGTGFFFHNTIKSGQKT